MHATQYSSKLRHRACSRSVPALIWLRIDARSVDVRMSSDHTTKYICVGVGDGNALSSRLKVPGVQYAINEINFKRYINNGMVYDSHN
jgi:hypothetical protein